MDNKTITQIIDIPGSDQKVSVELDLVPAEGGIEMFLEQPNVTRVKLGGKEFLAVVGKTTVQ